jgi:hypothetical protein
MNEHEKPDLSSIPPIGKLPDEDGTTDQVEDAEGVGLTPAVVAGTPAAVGGESTKFDRAAPDAPSDEDAELEKLRRG